MSEHRGQEQHEYEEIGDMVDEISNLPDCMLHHILSFMPTKEAVKTSILSTRWTNLWASVPNIDLDDDKLWLAIYEGDGRRETSFVNFVERVLGLRDASNLEKFHLSCCDFRGASQIHSWISYAIMNNVKELDVSIYGVDPSVIPRCMFDSTSLVSLKIRMKCDIELPCHFPCLKILHLWFDQLENYAITEELFSGCPVLEEFELSTFDLMKDIVISSSTLKRLTISDQSYYYLSDCCNITIDAANLTFSEYNGLLSNDILVNNASSLYKTCLQIRCSNQSRDKVASKAIGLLKQLQHVVSLRLYNCTMETLSYADNMLVSFPVFQNLTHLMLSMDMKTEKIYPYRVVLDLLSFCPVLQSICFFEEENGSYHFRHNDSIWSSIPICILNCLKTVTLKNFHGYNSEICFLKCVLKYACALERVDIWWCESYLQSLWRKKEVQKELENIDRSSTASIINFSDKHPV